jgi:hypothetical protein
MAFSSRLREELLGEKNSIFRSLECLSSIDVKKQNGIRMVRCFCGAQEPRTILPHIKREHPEIWSEWQGIFVELRNREWSYEKIMNVFHVNGGWLFTWRVIERELQKVSEQGEATLQIWRKPEITEWEPKGFTLERTTVWDFPQRGNWAVHQSDYRGNWPPQLARNLILGYTRRGEVVVDLFVGGGTTLIEAWLTGRKSLGIDISPFAIRMTKARLDEMAEKSAGPNGFPLDHSLAPVVYRADSRQCDEVMSVLGWSPNSIALICAHPPYLDALQYTHAVEGDLSRIKSVDEFCSAMWEVAHKAYPWLKPGGIFAVLIGDVRKHSRMVPLGFKLLQEVLSIGYELKEIIIKTQNRDRSTHLWIKDQQLPFLIAHEYLFILSKAMLENG